MSGKGNWYDNAAILRREHSPPDCFLILLTFFKTIKAELIRLLSWALKRQTELAMPSTSSNGTRCAGRSRPFSGP
jgi:hypothetical protein